MNQMHYLLPKSQSPEQKNPPKARSPGRPASRCSSTRSRAGDAVVGNLSIYGRRHSHALIQEIKVIVAYRDQRVSCERRWRRLDLICQTLRAERLDGAL